MTVKLWANWDDERILTEAQMEEEIRTTYLPETADEDSFNRWLSWEYTQQELFEMEESEKTDVRNEFLDYALDTAWEEAVNEWGWNMVEIEI